MSIIHSHTIGVLLTEDEEGQDSKIIAVPTTKLDPNFSFVNVLAVPEHIQVIRTRTLNLKN